MVDRLKDILQKIQEWWNKFTAKQKTIIISVTAGVILALAVTLIIIVFCFAVNLFHHSWIFWSNSLSLSTIVVLRTYFSRLYLDLHQLLVCFKELVPQSHRVA